MPFQIIRNDITKVKADAIVNAANPQVAVGQGVDSAIYEVAGMDGLLTARQAIGELAPGEVGITPAYGLEAKYIIHASGIFWEDGKHRETEILRRCYERSLALAWDHQCQSIAFPLLATGSYGYPKELGLQIAVDAFMEFLENHEMDITLVVFGKDSFRISGSWADEIQSYIDDSYVEAAVQKEYSDKPSVRIAQRKVLKKNAESSDFHEEAISAAARGNTANLAASGKTVAMPGIKPLMGMSASQESLDHILKGIYTDSFEKHLQQLINKKGLKNSEVYAAANISKQYFSKLLKGQVKPSKEKVLALAVGLRLNLDETVDFLGIAGYALSPISQTDAVVRYFIMHEDYNVLKIDIVLFDYGLDPLSGGV